MARFARILAAPIVSAGIAAAALGLAGTAGAGTAGAGMTVYEDGTIVAIPDNRAHQLLSR